MAFRNLSRSETGSEQFEVAHNFKITTYLLLLSRLTQQDAQRGKEELLTGLCCYAQKYVLEYS